jgi:hypothetical protein
MTYCDYRAEAARYRRMAAAAVRQSKRDAASAASSYEHARGWARNARWLTARPDLWIHGAEGANPARSEQIAAALVQVADSYLSGVFRNMETARSYRELARDYDTLAAVRDYRLAAIETAPERS